MPNDTWKFKMVSFLFRYRKGVVLGVVAYEILAMYAVVKLIAGWISN